MKRRTKQRGLDEAPVRAQSGVDEGAGSKATAAVGPRGLQPGAGASRPAPGPVSGPPVPLPRELARAEQRPFVGRAAPLRRLRELWSESWRGHGGLVALAGEPGIGKTRLAARFAAEVHAEAGLVLYGRADEESVSPYQPFVEALRHYAACRPGLADEPCLETAMQLLAGLVPELGRPPAAAVGRLGDRRMTASGFLRRCCSCSCTPPASAGCW